MRPSKILKSGHKRKARAKGNPLDYRAHAAKEFAQAFERLFGSQGAASPVRRIDPITGNVIETLAPRPITPPKPRHI